MTAPWEYRDPLEAALGSEVSAAALMAAARHLERHVRTQAVVHRARCEPIAGERQRLGGDQPGELSAVRQGLCARRRQGSIVRQGWQQTRIRTFNQLEL